ncbi:hypothetical protein G210_1316, partial [Candida maltosa Xu316]
EVFTALLTNYFQFKEEEEEPSSAVIIKRLRKCKACFFKLGNMESWYNSYFFCLPSLKNGFSGG